VLNFQILVFVAVKMCKQCLQTASASIGTSASDSLPGFYPWIPMGTSVPRPRGL